MATAPSNSKAFQITVQGNAEIPHPAERAVVNLNVTSTGLNKAEVSDEVITTAKHIESLLRDLGPKEETSDSPLSHWSKKGLSSTSHIPYSRDGEELPKKYTSTIRFDIRFKDFKALGSFGTKVSSLSHVEVQNIDWILTPATERSFRSQLRKEAAKDAIEKAKDYCEAMGCVNVRPSELSEGEVEYPRSQSRGAVMLYSQELGGGGQPDEKDLEFDPQEIKMSLEVTVKFLAEFV